jgi:hypothetical protein
MEDQAGRGHDLSPVVDDIPANCCQSDAVFAAEISLAISSSAMR